MKSILSNLKWYYLIAATGILLLNLSCNEYSMEKNEDTTQGAAATTDSTATGTTSMMPGDTMSIPKDSLAHPPSVDSTIQSHLDRPVRRPEDQKPATGTAMVYCPSTMLRDVPSIINATISKDEMSKAIEQFKQKIQEENPTIKSEDISSNIKSNQIDIYEKMGISLEFDPADFKEISKHPDVAKSFGSGNALEWEWYLKPLHTTRRSIINFRFYYLDPNNSAPQYFHEKTITVAVRIDPRSYVDQWRDFLLGDPKNTTTAILIPLCTFIGGIFTGRKRKKDS